MEPIEYKEVVPLPAVCAECKEEECYNCDHLLERWEVSTADEGKLKSLLAKQRERHDEIFTVIAAIDPEKQAICPVCRKVFDLDASQKEVFRAERLIPICHACQANVRANGVRHEKDGQVFWTLSTSK